MTVERYMKKAKVWCDDLKIEDETLAFTYFCSKTDCLKCVFYNMKVADDICDIHLANGTFILLKDEK